MSKPATPILLSDEERAALEHVVRGARTERRMVMRARIVLAAGEGRATTHIAASMGFTPATVSKWRTRFGRDRMEGLRDAPRSGQPVRYGAAAEKRILAMLDQPPPSGYATWNGSLR